MMDAVLRTVLVKLGPELVAIVSNDHQWIPNLQKPLIQDLDDVRGGCSTKFGTPDEERKSIGHDQVLIPAVKAKSAETL